MKVSVGGWNERAARDHHAARRDAEADVKYIITREAGKGTALKSALVFFSAAPFTSDSSSQPRGAGASGLNCCVLQACCHQRNLIR